MKNCDTALEDLVVLLLDCQTTGANPRSGSVIEIGWARSDALGDGEEVSGINARIFKKPSDFEIPARVQKITGINMDDIVAGSDPEDVWAEILTTAEAVVRLNRKQMCPTVIHFAKFELPFLTKLHAMFGAKKDFPFTFICTHEISRHLFPELPRRSIRAIAGYFGHSLHELRRCREHVQATAIIWREILRVLRERHGIKTFEQLMGWLHQPKVIVSTSRSYPMSAHALQRLPQNPGVYRMLRSNGDVLYVGKANSIKQRVRSYFRKGSRHPEHILEMLSQAKRLDLTVTESVLEAAILESDDIKRLMPQYNIALRKGNRDVWFYSNDFCEYGPQPTRRHKIGPIVDREAMSNFAAIIRVTEMGDISGTAPELLMSGIGVPEGFAPEYKCIKAGYEIFMKRHAGVLRRRAAAQSLNAVGRQLWIERQKGKICENTEMEDLVLRSIEIPAWTPDSVCRLIESNVIRAGHAMRRAHWFIMLTESTLGWIESSVSDGSYFLIVFEKGQILYRRVQTMGELPIPPGHRRHFIEKQRSFDTMTYDRMRVVTTEIRKVISSGRWFEIRFTPVNTLGCDDLINLLSWV
ncbi:MAG: exonuclease domain-containing protein [candidate division WOR-3 bacterium]|nr:exonuclease domain-containing protein [candidate division WOR-3 bacterium]